MDDRLAFEVQSRRAAAVEHLDQRRVADAE
jgi:hypothetical protein